MDRHGEQSQVCPTEFTLVHRVTYARGDAMRLLSSTISLMLLLYSGPLRADDSAEVAKPVEMIFWERERWGPQEWSARLTLWADGKSQIEVTQRSAARPKKGWT